MRAHLFLAFLIIVSLLAGGSAYTQLSTFRKAERHFFNGDTLLVNGGSGAAIPEFEKALALYPEHLGAWVGLIDCHLEMEKWDLALATSDRALMYFPSSTAVYRGRATAHSHKGERATAIADLEKCVQLDPGDPLNLRLLERARKNPSPTPSATASATPVASPHPSSSPLVSPTSSPKG